MTKTNIILIFIINTLISAIIGFIIGININNTFISNKKLIGTYRNKEEIIALKKDKSMIFKKGKGTWSIENGRLYIEYDYIDEALEAIDEFDNMWKNTQNKKKSDYKQHAKEEITIVENGLIYNNNFYEKITK
jgi:hypothetical protein